MLDDPDWCAPKAGVQNGHFFTGTIVSPDDKARAASAAFDEALLKATPVSLADIEYFEMRKAHIARRRKRIDAAKQRIAHRYASITSAEMRDVVKDEVREAKVPDDPPRHVAGNGFLRALGL